MECLPTTGCLVASLGLSCVVLVTPNSTLANLGGYCPLPSMLSDVAILSAYHTWYM